MMNKFLIAGLATAMAVPVVAQPATVPPVQPTAPVMPIAPTMDIAPMADRVITRAEMLNMVQQHFARMDKNRDGMLAGDELKPNWTHGQAPGGAMAMRHREPGDANAAFDRLDTNRDGMISREEFAKAREIRIEKRVTMGGPGAAGGDHGAMGMRGMHRMHGMMGGGRMMKIADTNKDGRITLQEATSAALQHFDMADANRDGRLTPDEMRAARQQRVRMHKAS